ncbi:MAG: hypothetical protein JSR69_19450 [Proteobacteria bacterium]|uniref:hypothetical protein n=1 Tax=Zoogloea sp. TaxID=49181 RepID=UPI0035B1187F|nr:hypothetical protein [Pseudomonadota bacterium]
MYPVQDVDALLLLSMLLATKRRPADMVEIVAAADLLDGGVGSEARWAEAFRRFATHDLIVEVDGRYTLTEAGVQLVHRLPKKADTAERIFLLREKLSEYEPAEKTPSIVMQEEQVAEAVRAHQASKSVGGKNLLMPKAKPVEEDVQPRRRPGGWRRG